MLRVQNLEVVYDDVMLVLRGVSLEVPHGGSSRCSAPNGAGKTTLLRALSGLLGVHDGAITRAPSRLTASPSTGSGRPPSSAGACPR